MGPLQLLIRATAGVSQLAGRVKCFEFTTRRGKTANRTF